MSYKPKYCCQCGEKIENINKKLFASPRFCELCATDFGFYDSIQRAVSGIGLILIVFIISNYFQKPGKPLNIASNQLKGDVQGVKTVSHNRVEVPPVQNTDTVQVPARQSNGALPVNSAAAIKTADPNEQKSGKTPVEASEKTYLCGAPTQKGTPCSRRVKGGGRCWQHEGQPASVSSDKQTVRR